MIKKFIVVIFLVAAAFGNAIAETEQLGTTISTIRPDSHRGITAVPGIKVGHYTR